MTVVTPEETRRFRYHTWNATGYRAPSHQEGSTLFVRPVVMAVGVPLTGSKNMSCCTQTLRSGVRPEGARGPAE